MMLAGLDNNIKTARTSMLRNQRNLWFSGKFKIDKRTGKSIIALSPAKKHSFARPQVMQHDAWHLTICGIASRLGRKHRYPRASDLSIIYGA
jgi:hypothetical protein